LPQLEVIISLYYISNIAKVRFEIRAQIPEHVNKGWYVWPQNLPYNDKFRLLDRRERIKLVLQGLGVNNEEVTKIKNPNPRKLIINFSDGHETTFKLSQPIR
jgi:hypothetical protein